MAVILYPLSLIFDLITRLRHACFEYGLIPIYRSKLPVISIGNITVGGTGKTPLILFLAEHLVQQGKKPVILSRGYKGSCAGPAQVTFTLDDANDYALADAAATFGDEPVLMAQKAICPVVVARKRVHGAQFIETEQLGDIILLDDGFQHRRLWRDKNIVCIDCSSDASIAAFARGVLLPAGIFRESIAKSFKRIDQLCLSFRKSVVQPLPEWYMQETLTRLGLSPSESQNVWCSFYEAMTVKNIEGQELAPCPVVPLVGIAQPEGFLSSLRTLGFEPVHQQFIFSDHYRFTVDDVHTIFSHMQTGAKFVCTEKDFVRLPNSLQQHVYVLSGTLKVQSAQPIVL